MLAQISYEIPFLLIFSFAFYAQHFLHVIQQNNITYSYAQLRINQF